MKLYEIESYSIVSFQNFLAQDPFFKDKELEAELSLDDEDMAINPRTMYQKRLRGRMELVSQDPRQMCWLNRKETSTIGSCTRFL